MYCKSGKNILLLYVNVIFDMVSNSSTTILAMASTIIQVKEAFIYYEIFAFLLKITIN